MVASHRHHKEVVEVLVSAGADVHATNVCVFFSFVFFFTLVSEFCLNPILFFLCFLGRKNGPVLCFGEWLQRYCSIALSTRGTMIIYFRVLPIFLSHFFFRNKQRDQKKRRSNNLKTAEEGLGLGLEPRAREKNGRKTNERNQRNRKKKKKSKRKRLIKRRRKKSYIAVYVTYTRQINKAMSNISKGKSIKRNSNNNNHNNNNKKEKKLLRRRGRRERAFTIIEIVKITLCTF